MCMDRITRITHARSAGLLGLSSSAGQALRRFEEEKEQGRRPVAFQRNNGFAVTFSSVGGVPETITYG